jgi:hypothetical protein
MKRILFFVIFSVLTTLCNAQCADTCQYKTYYMHNHDTTKYNLVEIQQQGIFGVSENKILGSGAAIQYDSYKGTFDIHGYSSNGEQNFIYGNNDMGIEMTSFREISINSPIEIKIQVGYGYMSIKRNGIKTIIHVPNMPTSCAGESTGTWANIGGFLKVCP